ncbi:hypothetical protein EIP91_005080 [Steccherinum ochraceum]|uniref:Protein kinase domain-containing protein n=1 Tax=Steccherinum ochraceum TaxID=92696 RepID=A0A4R0RG39_9APHY|nr:hypothetical protein EIP91_005080 [Steccherinum ochraceum]
MRPSNFVRTTGPVTSMKTDATGYTPRVSLNGLPTATPTMAEIATIAGLTITVPGILSGAWTVLKAAYDLYGSVDRRRQQMQVLLDRCGDLIAQIARHLQANRDAAKPTMDEARSLEAACQSVKDIMDVLAKKGFMWCMMHQDKIDNSIAVAERNISDAFSLFNVVAHLDGARFRRELAAARVQDQAVLSRKLEQLSENDQLILSAIQDQNGVHRRLEDLLIAISKHIQDRPRGNTPEDMFLTNAANVLHRISGGRSNLPPDWVLSSLEVEFDQRDLIGQGSFGRIFKGEWNGAVVAIKQMYVEDARELSSKDRKAMLKEVKTWSRLQHPNVLSLYGACLENTVPFLVMKHCQYGNICGYIKKQPQVSEAERVRLSYDVVSGLAYLHSKQIVHADLKGVNVLVGDDHRAVLTDFGLSITLDDIRTRSASSTHHGATQGTLRWMAPECLDGKPSSKAADVYALGITFWEIFSDGDIPLKGVPERDNAAAQLRISTHFLDSAATRPSAPPIPLIPLPLGTESISSERWRSTVSAHRPEWTRGNPPVFVDSVTFPQVLTDKPYTYRVVKGGEDLGVKPSYEVQQDGSQTVNLLEYNQGYGVHETTPVEVYAVDPDDERETLVAEWNNPKRR